MKKFLSVFLCVLFLFTVAILPASAEGDVINNYVNETDLSPVTTWLSDIFDTLTERLSKVVNNIADGFNYLYDVLRQQIQNVLNSISSAASTIKTAISNKLEELRTRIVETVNQIKSIYTWLGDTRDRVKTYVEDKLEYLFVPKFSFEDKLNEWQSILLEKFSFFNDIISLFNKFLNFSETTDVPKFEFTYKGTTVGIINFAPYAYMRPVVQGIILALAWWSFLRRLIHSLPGFIMSATGSSARVTANESNVKE